MDSREREKKLKFRPGQIERSMVHSIKKLRTVFAVAAETSESIVNGED